MFVSEIQVQGNPEDIPEIIKIDVSNLEHGDSILLKDLHIAENLKADITEDKVIATVGELVYREEEIEVAATTEL